MYHDKPLLRDILLKTQTPHFITANPDGLSLYDGRLLPSIEARILAYGQARTLYRGRKPHCRSLDAMTALNGQKCAECHERKHCTLQVRLDLLFENEVHRLLLAYTSAKNFLLYANGRPASQLETFLSRITIRNRHTWGELLFSELPSKP